MKASKGLTGLLVFVISLWAAIVATYASQAKNGGATGPDGVPFPEQSASCTSSGGTSSGGAE